MIYQHIDGSNIETIVDFMIFSIFSSNLDEIWSNFRLEIKIETSLQNFENNTFHYLEIIIMSTKFQNWIKIETSFFNKYKKWEIF